jgi:hypothetical protein
VSGTPAGTGWRVERNFFHFIEVLDALASQLKHVRPGEKIDLRAINLPKEQR